jgi:hypothetical protein
LCNVHLELWDSDDPVWHVGDDRMDLRDPNTGQDRDVSFSTDANGYFVIDGYGGDGCCSWGNPEPYVAALLQNEGLPRVSAQDEIEHIRSKTSGEHRFDNVCGVQTYLGDLIYDGDAAPGEFTRCEDFLELRRVAQDYYDLMGAEPPYGEVRMLIWSISGGLTYADYDKIRWSVSRSPGKHIAGGRFNSTVGHEFAHTVFFTFDGNHAHWTGDLSAFRYASTHEYCDEHFTPGFIDYQRRGFSFSEGWADYWEGKWNGCGTCQGSTVPCIPYSGEACGSNVACGGSNYVSSACCDQNWSDTTNFEGNVARAFRALETACGLSRAQLVGIFAANPGQIHSWDEYYAKIRAAYPTCNVDLSGVLSASSALRETPDETVIDRAAELAVETRDRDLLTQAASSLKTQFQAARASAKAPCAFGTADCAAIQIAPWAARAAFLHAKLELQRRAKLKPSKVAYKQRESRMLEKNKNRYRKRLSRIMIKMLSRARHAVAKLDGDYSATLQKLDSRQQAIREAVATGRDLPAFAYDSVALQGGTGAPEPGCGETYPSCDGVCAPGELCVAQTIDRPFGCQCVVVPPCGDTSPSCNGVCPPGQVCTPQTIDIPFGCVCEAPPVACGDTAPTCDGACPPPASCRSLDGGDTCICYSECR